MMGDLSQIICGVCYYAMNIVLFLLDILVFRIVRLETKKRTAHRMKSMLRTSVNITYIAICYFFSPIVLMALLPPPSPV